MKRIPSAFGGCLIAVWIGLASCGGPMLILPGGELSGEEAAAPASWPDLADGVFELETRPDDPYSVQINYRVIDGQLMIDPAEGRGWLDNLRADARVRVRIDGKVMRMQAVLVGEPGAPAPGFENDRFVYRLEAR